MKYLATLLLAVLIVLLVQGQADANRVAPFRARPGLAAVRFAGRVAAAPFRFTARVATAPFRAVRAIRYNNGVAPLRFRPILAQPVYYGNQQNLVFRQRAAYRYAAPLVYQQPFVAQQNFQYQQQQPLLAETAGCQQTQQFRYRQSLTYQQPLQVQPQPLQYQPEVVQPPCQQTQQIQYQQEVVQPPCPLPDTAPPPVCPCQQSLPLVGGGCGAASALNANAYYGMPLIANGYRTPIRNYLFGHRHTH